MNKQYKAIVVDDEEWARDVLRKLIAKFCPELEVVAVCNDLLSAKQSIDLHQPDVVFLDIEMPNYAGYEIVNFFPEIDFEIIFVTAYENYAAKAFEVSAFDYLLKPVEVSRLIASVQRFIENRKLKNIKDAYLILQENLKEDKVKKIIFRKNNGSMVVAVPDIIAIQAQQAYCSIITESEIFTTSKNLGYYQSLLETESIFFRSHKSWIINRNFLIQYSKTNLDIKLQYGVEAKLSKYKTLDFEAYLLT
jgi:two-component system LytT family response regulator